MGTSPAQATYTVFGGALDMGSNRGLALVTALMVLSFLAVIGAALLSTTTIDTTIGINHRVRTQLTFLAEAGLEDARESLRAAVEARIDADPAVRTLTEGITAVLRDHAGADGTLAASRDPAVLLDAAATDDVRFLDAVAFPSGEAAIGTYTVLLRNDTADGASSATDTNEIVTILSIARIGASTKTVEIDVMKGRFPDLPAALTLGGGVADDAFGPGRSGAFRVDGTDAGGGPPAHGVGVVDAASADAVSDDIAVDPPVRGFAYCGAGTAFPASCVTDGPDVENVGTLMDARLRTPEGLERLAASIAGNATHQACPTGNWGSPEAPSVTVTGGDCAMRGAGHGLLLVRGSLVMEPNARWRGLVVVMDDAACVTTGPPAGRHWTVSFADGARIDGGLFVANTGGDGSALTDVCVDAAGSGGIRFDTDTIRNAAAGLPFHPIAWREF